MEPNCDDCEYKDDCPVNYHRNSKACKNLYNISKDEQDFDRSYLEEEEDEGEV